MSVLQEALSLFPAAVVNEPNSTQMILQQTRIFSYKKKMRRVLAAY